MTRPVVLLDIDGVCADFVGAVLREVQGITGRVYTPEDVTQWELNDALNLPQEVRDQLEDAITSNGFCTLIEPYPEAYDGLLRLRELADVYALTTPYDSMYWMYERKQWLTDRFDFSHREIIYAHTKHLVRGDVLIDDKTETVVGWQRANDDLGGIVFDRPWNRNDKWSGRRADWSNLVDVVRDYL